MKATCTHYGKCSGCSLQQFPYIKQIHDKSRLVLDKLGPLTPKSSSLIETIVQSPLEFGYRTSSKLCLHEDDTGRRSIGLYEQASKKVLHIPKCSVHNPEINKICDKLFGFGPLPARLYNHTKKAFQPDRLKFLTLRYNPELRVMGLVFSHTGVDLAALAAWLKGIKLGSVSIYESRLKAEDGDLVMSTEVGHLLGPKTLPVRLEPFQFELSPLSFFQANAKMLPLFVQTITEHLKGGMLLDLYGGFGSYSFAAYSRFAKIHLVEVNPHAIASAIAVLKSEKIEGIETHGRSTEDFLKSFRQQKQTTHIIVNPPRTGLSSTVVQELSRPNWSALETLSYVSCNIETLQRDLRLLLRSNTLEITRIVPFDMFPQTQHLEVLVELRPKLKAKDGIKAISGHSSRTF